MPPITILPITALPDPPTKADPTNFALRADAFLDALPDFGDELNAAATEMNKIISGLDQTSPIAAYDSGTTYDFPDVVAGTNGQTYRCLGTGIVGVDPLTDDGSTWARVGPSPIDNLVSLGSVGTSEVLDTAKYDTFVFTCDQSTLDLSGTAIAIGRTVTLIIDGGDTCDITWPTGTKWSYGVEPARTSLQNRVVLQRVSSTVIHASMAGQDYA